MLTRVHFLFAGFRAKITWIVVGASALALLLACGAFTVNEYVTFEKDLIRRQAAVAKVVAANVSAAVLFDDPIVAEDILEAFSQSPEILRARVLDRDGETFAIYGDLGADHAENAESSPASALSSSATLLAAEERFAVHNDLLHLDVPIVIEPDVVGRLVVDVSMEGRSAILSSYLGIGLLVFSISILVAGLIGLVFARRVTGPVAALTRAMARIRKTRDYAAIVDVHAGDEVGEMVAAFNAMLGEIQTRDRELASLVHQLVDARDAAEAANVAKSQFLANTSHELRTPLNAIIGFSEILIEDSEAVGQTTQLSDLRRIHAAGRHLLSLINEILDLSKIEAGRLQLEIGEFSPGDLAREVADTIAPLIAKGGNRLSVELAPDLGMARSDAFKIRQCLMNLLSNAAKFTDSGEINLRVWRHRCGPRDALCFTVRDSGIGMTPEQIGNLFQAFTQADASVTRGFGGTGLGLTITRRMAQALGGDVTVESDVGIGSAFTLTIDATFEAERDNAQSAASAQLVASSLGPSSTNAGWVLVHDPAGALTLRLDALQKSGFQVRHVRDAEALAKAIDRERRPPVLALAAETARVPQSWRIFSAMAATPQLQATPRLAFCGLNARKRALARGANAAFPIPADDSALLALVRQFHTQRVGEVMIIDDDPVAGRVLEIAFRQFGWTARVVVDGVEALAAVEQRLPDLVICDWAMPRLDGAGLLREINGRCGAKAPACFIVSGTELTKAEKAALPPFVCGQFVKGAFSIRDLVDAARKALEPPEHNELPGVRTYSQ